MDGVTGEDEGRMRRGCGWWDRGGCGWCDRGG